jgi:uncharacterized protein (TIGR04168 family)
LVSTRDIGAGQHVMVTPPTTLSRIAVVGDMHSVWDARDVDYFNTSQYELLLVVGDLGGSRARDGLRVASSLARLTRFALVMPGNNDVDEYAQIAAEFTYRRGRADLLEDLEEPTPDAAEHDQRARMCGYSMHPVSIAGFDLTVIAGRPFSMGGAELSFPEQLERNFGVRSMAESAQRLRDLVERAPTEQLIFFAHNGPTGLGAERHAVWGRDFDPAAGDWGDPDLREAISHAITQKRKPLAVIAGHMHSPLRGGGDRQWQKNHEGTLYINPARVPRAFETKHGPVRHHIALDLSPTGAQATEVLIPDIPIP